MNITLKADVSRAAPDAANYVFDFAKFFLGGSTDGVAVVIGAQVFLDSLARIGRPNTRPFRLSGHSSGMV